MTNVDSKNTTHTLSIHDKDMEERVRLCTEAILMDDTIQQLKYKLQSIIQFYDKPIVRYYIDKNGFEREMIIGTTHLNRISLLEQEIFERTESIKRFYKI